ncbi:MAG: NAD(P)/FAD-dependent oxidoreductase [Culturomica sp.]|jgi:uncharacterized FAD-dependent dehydrogenase|nr:NAD(P)/FAD-dependent oxidoreductase [Culturomica sp.]
MYKEIAIRVSPEEAGREELFFRELAARQEGIEAQRIKRLSVVRRSVDARQRRVVINLTLGIHIDSIEEPAPLFVPVYRDVSAGRRVVVIGAGPAGLFAALRLIERGFRPLVLERGKPVAERKKDLAHLYATGCVSEDSNFGFGEGGAGTFSDGKLFTRSRKRGDVRRILEILVYHGADRNILVDAHPHLGTDQLPGVIANIRKTIERYGGEVRFTCRVTDLLVKAGAVRGVIAGGEELAADEVILATGHSARDIYRMLHARSVYMEPKDFAAGLRLEHPQSLIDRLQYHTPQGRGKWLPAAEYSFVSNVENRGVYSFCMCPGGVVVPAATGPEQQVVNGMSSSARNTPWANSAVVTSIGREELEGMGFSGLFAGMEFQECLEREAWKRGGGALRAPAQRLTDFMHDRLSGEFPRVSYKPGITATRFHEWLPEIVTRRLKAGLALFGQRARGFLTDQAVLLGVETRTSAPLRIPRGSDRLVHPGVAGLYPCGEGAGYAGGIVSAAMDGEKCAESVQ